MAPISLDLVISTFRYADKSWRRIFRLIGQDDAAERARRAFRQVDMLSLAEDAGISPPARLVHGLVSRVTRFHNEGRSRRRELRAACVRALGQILDAVADIRVHRHIEPEVMHAKELIAEVQDVKSVTLMRQLGRYYLARGLAREGATFFQKELTVAEKVFGPTHSMSLAAMHNLALTLSEQGDLATAQAYQE